MAHKICNPVCVMDGLVEKRESEFRKIHSRSKGSNIFTHLFIQYILSTKYCCRHRIIYKAFTHVFFILIILSEFFPKYDSNSKYIHG